MTTGVMIRVYEWDGWGKDSGWMVALNIEDLKAAQKGFEKHDGDWQVYYKRPNIFQEIDLTEDAVKLIVESERKAVWFDYLHEFKEDY